MFMSRTLYNVVSGLTIFSLSVVTVISASAQTQRSGLSNQGSQSGIVVKVSAIQAKKNQIIKRKANKNAITLVTGGISETQISFAQDFADVLDVKDSKSEEGLRVLSILGKGGVQNALDLLHLRGVDLAILPSDSLTYLRGADPLFYKNIFDRIKFISSLYHAEWHVVARKNIRSLHQLRGKRVNISLPLSGAYVTSRKILELLGIRVRYSTLADRVALEKLKKGKLDAVIMLGGSPIGLLNSIKKEDGLHLVPADFYSKSIRELPFVVLLRQLYVPLRLSHEQYPNLIPRGKTIPTIGNGVMLAAYNWNKKNARREKILRFAKKFVKKFDKFKQPGRHQKWREVNLLNAPYEWRRFDFMKGLLNDHTRNIKTGHLGGGQTDAKLMFKDFVKFINKRKEEGEKMTKQQQILLFREFKEYIGRTR